MFNRKSHYRIQWYPLVICQNSCWKWPFIDDLPTKNCFSSTAIFVYQMLEGIWTMKIDINGLMFRETLSLWQFDVSRNHHLWKQWKICLTRWVISSIKVSQRTRMALHLKLRRETTWLCFKMENSLRPLRNIPRMKAPSSRFRPKSSVSLVLWWQGWYNSHLSHTATSEGVGPPSYVCWLIDPMNTVLHIDRKACPLINPTMTLGWTVRQLLTHHFPMVFLCFSYKVVPPSWLNLVYKPE